MFEAVVTKGLSRTVAAHLRSTLLINPLWAIGVY